MKKVKKYASILMAVSFVGGAICMVWGVPFVPYGQVLATAMLVEILVVAVTVIIEESQAA